MLGSCRFFYFKKYQYLYLMLKTKTKKILKVDFVLNIK